MKNSKKYITVAVAGFLSACGTPQDQALDSTIRKQEDQAGCENYSTLFWDSLDQYRQTKHNLPQLKATLDSLKHLEEKAEISPTVAKALKEIYQVLLAQPLSGEDLSALEIGDETTEKRAALKKKLRPWLMSLSQQSSPRQCPTEPAIDPNDIFEKKAKGSSWPRSFLGMRWSFSTAYQSCQAVSRNPLETSAVDVDGIKILGRHPDNVGQVRVISDLPRVLSTHHYYKKPEIGVQCEKFRQATLIYDYGGKPLPMDGETPLLDMFTNSGSGSEALGIDCSALIFSAVASAGLRLDPKKPLRARYVNGISSRMYMEPEKNDLGCFDYVSVGPGRSIQAGDIAAVNGHVLMIGDLGPDPFGINELKDLDDCSFVSYKNFDFDVWQSSPSKNGIGINRFKVKDYLSDSLTMRLGFESFARKECVARIKGQTDRPKNFLFSIVRHKMTDECRERRIPLVGESCIQECPDIF